MTMNANLPDDPATRRALEHLRAVLTANETLEAWALQHRLFALTHRRLLVAATSGRLLALARGFLGGFNLTDVRWQDLKEVRIEVGLFGATLTVIAYASPDLASSSGATRLLVFDGLVKRQAEALYRIAQGHDQAWREKRRIRDLEEMRARAGGVQVGSLGGLGGVGGSVTGGEGDLAHRLQQAKSMLDSGLISDSEYEALKARIISQI
jgi:hypothetical protein